jgi:hypothetical protein
MNHHRQSHKKVRAELQYSEATIYRERGDGGYRGAATGRIFEKGFGI